MAGGGDLVLGADPAVSGLQPGQQLSEDGVALKIHRTLTLNITMHNLYTTSITKWPLNKGYACSNYESSTYH